MSVLLEARGIKKYFPVTSGAWKRQRGLIKAVDDVSFSIAANETFGLVGESGCGKTTASRLVLLVEKLTAGTLSFEGKPLGGILGKDLKIYRSCVQAVFQDPYSSLSPRMRVGDFIAEPLLFNTTISRKEAAQRAKELLSTVGLPASSANLYPHEFSGGQRQRIAIARAIGLRPKLLVLDEPISALDVSIRAQIMNLLRDLQDEFGLAYLLIAHDLAVVKHMSNRIGVMYLGKLMEMAESDELHSFPLHPYTRALLSAALPSHPDASRDEITLPGEPSSPLDPPPGCRLQARCLQASPKCRQDDPPLVDVGNRHWVACHSIAS